MSTPVENRPDSPYPGYIPMDPPVPQFPKLGLGRMGNFMFAQGHHTVHEKATSSWINPYSMSRGEKNGARAAIPNGTSGSNGSSAANQGPGEADGQIMISGEGSDEINEALQVLSLHIKKNKDATAGLKYHWDVHEQLLIILKSKIDELSTLVNAQSATIRELSKHSTDVLNFCTRVSERFQSIEKHIAALLVGSGETDLEDIKQRLTELENAKAATFHVPDPHTFNGSKGTISCEEWIASIKAYLLAMNSLGGYNLSEQQMVAFIAAYLTGDALRYWHDETGCKVDHAACEECVSGEEECTHGNAVDSSGVPQTADEAFRLLEKRFIEKEDYMPKWTSLKQTSTVRDLDATLRRIYSILTPLVNRKDMKDKFWSALREDLRRVITEKLNVTKRQIDCNLSYQEVVNKALTAERMEADCSSRRAIVRPGVTYATATATQTVSSSSHSKLTTAGEHQQGSLAKIRSGSSGEAFRQGKHLGAPFNAIDKKNREYWLQKMPRKNTDQWFEYCRIRPACFLCGTPRHSSEDCYLEMRADLRKLFMDGINNSTQRKFKPALQVHADRPAKDLRVGHYADDATAATAIPVGTPVIPNLIDA